MSFTTEDVKNFKRSIQDMVFLFENEILSEYDYDIGKELYNKAELINDSLLELIDELSELKELLGGEPK